MRRNTIDYAQEMAKGRSFWHDVFVRFFHNKLAILGLILLLCVFIVCIYGFIFIDYDTDVIEQNVRIRLQTPNAEHILGTDGLGRDVFSRLVYGSRYSLLIGFTATIGAVLIGGCTGAISGYFGGKLDNILMRIMDILIAIPSVLLAIAIVSALGSSMINLIIAIMIADVPIYARLIRSAVLSVRDSEFVESAICVGSGHTHIILTHILPNSIAPVIVQATLGVGNDMISASSMSFLGLGIAPPAPEWGNMLSEGQEFIRNDPWLVIFPGLAIMLTVLALNLLGDGLRDSIDPKLKD